MSPLITLQGAWRDSQRWCLIPTLLSPVRNYWEISVEVFPRLVLSGSITANCFTYLILENSKLAGSSAWSLTIRDFTFELNITLCLSLKQKYSYLDQNSFQLLLPLTAECPVYTTTVTSWIMEPPEMSMTKPQNMSMLLVCQKGLCRCN